MSGGDRKLVSERLVIGTADSSIGSDGVVLAPGRHVAHDKAAVGPAFHPACERRQDISLAPRGDLDIRKFERCAFLIEQPAHDRRVRLKLHHDRTASCFVIVVQHLHLADVRLRAAKENAVRFVRQHSAYLERCDRAESHGAAAPLRFEDVNAVPNGFAGGIHNRERDDSARIKHEIARDIFASRYRVEHVQGVRGPEPARLQL